MSGQQSRAMLTLEGQLTNRDSIVSPRPLVKWSFEAPDPASVPAVIARAAHFAMADPSGPVYVSVPLDDWRSEANPDLTGVFTARRVVARPVPPVQMLQSLADRLSSARSPILVMGADVDTEEVGRPESTLPRNAVLEFS
jgi:benzoylformate decarboxylase